MAIASLVHRDPLFAFPRGLQLGLRRAAPTAAFTPNVDVVESDAEYRILAELPGLEEADFAVEIEDGVLTLRGEKKPRHPRDDDAESRSGYWRVETRDGCFERRLRFAAEVDEAAVKASFSHGVLDVRVPKRAEARPEVRTIPVQTS